MLFVWKQFGHTYFPGIAFAIAGDREAAIQYLVSKYAGQIPGVENLLRKQEPETCEVNDINGFIQMGGE